MLVQINLCNICRELNGIDCIVHLKQISVVFKSKWIQEDSLRQKVSQEDLNWFIIRLNLGKLTTILIDIVMCMQSQLSRLNIGKREFLMDPYGRLEVVHGWWLIIHSSQHTVIQFHSRNAIITICLGNWYSKNAIDALFMFSSYTGKNFI